MASAAFAWLFRPGFRLELCYWEGCSAELASFSVDQASADVASRRVDNEEKPKSLRHATGRSWNEEVLRAVGSRKLSAITQRAVINPHAKEPAGALKMRLHQLRFAPPELSNDGPHKWRDLAGPCGLSGRASGEAWSELFAELSELLISVLGALAEPRADHPRIVSDS